MANALILDTDTLGRVVISQLDGGLTQTAYALLSDLVAIRKSHRGLCHPGDLPGPPYTLARGDPNAPLRSRGSLASARSRCFWTAYPNPNFGPGH